MYIYKFKNKEGKVIYVGRTNNFKRRVKEEHFGGRGHLPEECYAETEYVSFGRVNSENESKMYELYYIEKYTPKYNTQGTGGGKITFIMPEIEWYLYEPKKQRGVSSKGEIRELAVQLGEELRDEGEYISNFLRGKDRVNWLEKLSLEEQNEYLRIIYTLDSFTTNIVDMADMYIEKVRG